jgi:hypothetical protein
MFLGLGMTGSVEAEDVEAFPGAFQAAENLQNPGQGVAVSPYQTTVSNPITLIWQVDPHAQKYWLWIDEPSTGLVIWDQWVTQSEIQCDLNANTCSYTIPDTIRAGNYIWWVLPGDEKQNGAWSESLPFVVDAAAVADVSSPDAVTTGSSMQGVVLAPSGEGVANSVGLTWQAVPEASEYWLWLDTEAGDNIWDQWVSAEWAGCSDGVSTCQFTLPVNLDPGNYGWWLLPSNADQHGEWSDSARFWVIRTDFDQLPGQPVLATPDGASVSDPVEFVWEADPYAAEYWLWIDVDGGGVIWDQWLSSNEVGCESGLGACSYTVNLALPSGSYIWWVMPSNVLGNGDWSTPKSFRYSDGSCSVPTSYPESVRQWCDLIETASAETGLPAGLIAAVIFQESGGNSLAYSSSGAVGLMQVMPRDGIAAGFVCSGGPCFASRPTIAELQNPAFNVAYGSQMLAGLYQKYGSYREALFRYGPVNMGYYYADKVLGIWNTYR